MAMNQYFNDNSKSVAVHVKMDAASVKSYLHSSSGNTHGGKLFAGMYVSGKIATGSQPVSRSAIPGHRKYRWKAVCLRPQWSS